MRRKIELKRDGMLRGWRQLHNEEFQLVLSPNIIATTKSKRKSLAGHVACIG
jgi:hypothetical protein